MPLLASFPCSHYRTFKHDSTEAVLLHLLPYFPHLVRDTRFVELLPRPRAPLLLLAYPQGALDGHGVY
jgi:hypothetical protein